MTAAVLSPIEAWRNGDWCSDGGCGYRPAWVIDRPLERVPEAVDREDEYRRASSPRATEARRSGSPDCLRLRKCHARGAPLKIRFGDRTRSLANEDPREIVFWATGSAVRPLSRFTAGRVQCEIAELDRPGPDHSNSRSDRIIAWKERYARRCEESFQKFLRIESAQ
jgi:hypothetical protein